MDYLAEDSYTEQLDASLLDETLVGVEEWPVISYPSYATLRLESLLPLRV